MSSTFSAAQDRVAFLMSPRSSNECQIDRRMYERDRFREIFCQCDAVIRRQLGWSLQDGLTFDGVTYRRVVTEAECEPAVTAVQIATVHVWRDRGIRPHAVAGASGGEYAAAFAAGALSLEDAMSVACCTGYALGRVVGVGETIAVDMNREDAAAYLSAAPEPVFLAAHYSQNRVALSGGAGAIGAVSTDLSSRNIRWRPVPAGMAVHSPLMDPLEDVFIGWLGHLRPRRPSLPIYSAAAGGLAADAAFDARHWWLVFRQPAYLADAVRQMLQDGYDTFADLGHQPVLFGAIREAAALAGGQVCLLQPDNEPEGRRAEDSRFDPASPDVRRDPYPYYHRLRAHSPVQFLPRAGCWAVLGHAQAMQVLKAPALFSSSILRGFDAALLGADPPAHTRIRQAVSEAFAQQRLALLETHMRALVHQLLDHVAEQAAFVVVETLAMPLPVLVIAELLGLATDKLDRLKRWSEAVVIGASGRPGPEERARLAAAGAEMERFLAEHIGRLTAAPDGSLLGDLVAGDAGRPHLPRHLTTREAASVARLLLIAGNETTTNLIGNTLLALLRNPVELARVQEDRTLVSAAIEETLRYDPPVQTVDRVTTQPVTLAGVDIPPQARIGVMLGAANRDPQVFSDPDTFSLARDPHGHIAFGGGPHFCLGSVLSRLETRVVIEGLLDRLPKLHAAQSLDEVEWTRSLHLRGPRRLMLAGPVA
jgi:cytochrome P450